MRIFDRKLRTMALISKVEYLGELRTNATHLKSGKVVITDAPPDNKGKGEAFSPTDLVSTALAQCMMTLMGIAADTHHIGLGEMRAEVSKIMASDPRRISEIQIEIYLPNQQLSEKEKTILERAARTCPVAQSLSENLVQSVQFHYE